MNATHEKTAYDLLVNNLMELNFVPETYFNRHMFMPIGDERMLSKKTVRVKADNDVLFIASDSFSTKANTSSTFTALYLPVELPAKAACKIYKKHKSDGLLLYRRKKTGVSYLDNNLTFTSKGWMPTCFLDEAIVHLFLELNTLHLPFKIIVEDNCLSDSTDEGANKLIILETNYWVYKKEELSLLLSQGVEILQRMKENIAKHYISTNNI